MNLAKVIIQKYETERIEYELDAAIKTSMEINLPLYLEQKDDYFIFDRKQFDMDFNHNLQAYYGFSKPAIAMIDENTLYKKLLEELLQKNLLIDYLEGFQRDWVEDLFENDFKGYSVEHTNTTITISESRKAEMTHTSFLKELKEENLLMSLCRFLEFEGIEHWGGEWYADHNYSIEILDDPRQLKLFPEETYTTKFPVGSIPNCS